MRVQKQSADRSPLERKDLYRFCMALLMAVAMKRIMDGYSVFRRDRAPAMCALR